MAKFIKASFLACIKARYAVLDYYEEASKKHAVRVATYGLLEPAELAEEAPQLALLGALESFAPIRAPSAVPIPIESAPEAGPVRRPSDDRDVYRTAKQLDTYHHVPGLSIPFAHCSPLGERVRRRPVEGLCATLPEALAPRTLRR